MTSATTAVPRRGFRITPTARMSNIHYIHTHEDSVLKQTARVVAALSHCYKQKVGAVLVDRGGRILSAGNNDIAFPQGCCPRGDAPSGVDYWKCQEICCQSGHAEESMLYHAPVELPENCIVHIYGHTYCCDGCIEQMREVGIRTVVIHREW